MCDLGMGLGDVTPGTAEDHARRGLSGDEQDGAIERARWVECPSGHPQPTRRDRRTGRRIVDDASDAAEIHADRLCQVSPILVAWPARSRRMPSRYTSAMPITAPGIASN